MVVKDIKSPLEKKDIESSPVVVQNFNSDKNPVELRPYKKKKKFISRKKKLLKRRKRRNKKKVLKRFKNIKRFKPFLRNHSSIFKNKLDFRLTANNIFCTFALLQKNQIIQSASAGMYKIKTSRKTIKYTYKKFVDIFAKKIKRKNKKNIKSKVDSFALNKSSILSITAIKKTHKRVIRKFRKAFRVKGRRRRRKPLLILINSKKCFNGCRVSKKRRKKRLKFRIFG